MSTVIKVENLSKQYRLGQVSTGTLMHDINRWFHKVRGLEDPYAKITGVNNRDTADDSEYIWALKDINFEVKQGEVLGIIGRNGAGKSTLLKILSKVTSPTIGQINVKGRIASLLEVGTGFHPELTGRENIFLNGAILGMTKTEIRSKFDEIVAFSGVEKYIDTPVKRYSSGMYVRLAFAVAAHLEPEILIVDEVLAVGDAEFQKKCLGKMKDVSKEGRTVLFVSHNLIAVGNLCSRSLLMSNGTLEYTGTTPETIDKYIQKNHTNINLIFKRDQKNLVNSATLNMVSVTPNPIELSSEIKISFEILFHTNCVKCFLAFDLIGMQDEIIFGSGVWIDKDENNLGRIECVIPNNLLNSGIYYIEVYIHDSNMRPIESHSQVVKFEVLELNRDSIYLGKIRGVIRPTLKWLKN